MHPNFHKTEYTAHWNQYSSEVHLSDHLKEEAGNFLPGTFDGLKNTPLYQKSPRQVMKNSFQEKPGKERGGVE